MAIKLTNVREGRSIGAKVCDNRAVDPRTGSKIVLVKTATEAIKADYSMWMNAVDITPPCSEGDDGRLRF